MLYQRQVLGFHGCAVERFEAALLHGFHPTASAEDYDWLGGGIYFWEHGPRRALEWAQDKCRREGRPVSDARVLGAVIQLGACLDLLDTAGTRLLANAYPSFVTGLPRSMPTPVNVSPARRSETLPKPADVLIRRLDCAVIEYAIKLTSRFGRRIQTVRGAFWEGGPAFPGAAIETKSHIQVAVRDSACINGYFNGYPSTEF